MKWKCSCRATVRDWQMPQGVLLLSATYRRLNLRAVKHRGCPVDFLKNVVDISAWWGCCCYRVVGTSRKANWPGGPSRVWDVDGMYVWILGLERRHCYWSCEDLRRRLDEVMRCCPIEGAQGQPIHASRIWRNRPGNQWRSLVWINRLEDLLERYWWNVFHPSVWHQFLQQRVVSQKWLWVGIVEGGASWLRGKPWVRWNT
jgi:hypothetical protein